MTKVEFVFSGRGYDPSSCVTAGELRKIGFELPDRIPDCAWIPCNGLIGSQYDCKSQLTRDTMYIKVEFKVRDPFYWERTSIDIDMTPDEVRETLKVAEEDSR